MSSRITASQTANIYAFYIDFINVTINFFYRANINLKQKLAKSDGLELE